jgi:hypothetical protein
MLRRGSPFIVAQAVGFLLLAAACSKAASLDAAPSRPEAETKDGRQAAAPGKLLFFDGFEYDVPRDEQNARPAFVTAGKWSGVKSENATGKGLGYLYTTNRIPGCNGPFPGRNSQRVLAIEARPKTFNNQTDFYLQYSGVRGEGDAIPADVWFQFWIYPNYYDDPRDQEDQLSGFGGGFKFIYPSVDDLDTSTASGKYEAWLTPQGGKPVKVAEWIDGVTPDFSWRIPAEKIGGCRCFRMPTTVGSFGQRARANKDCWMYLDDFAMASAEDGLPKYSE